MQPYELIRSGRRTLALEVRGGRVIVRAPYRASQAVIDRFVASHAEWIARGLAKQETRAAAHPEPTDAERANSTASSSPTVSFSTFHTSAL